MFPLPPRNDARAARRNLPTGLPVELTTLLGHHHFSILDELRRPEGATVDEVASVTGWQRHTVRGVFSGTLKKKLGLILASAKEERGRVYRIAEPASL